MRGKQILQYIGGAKVALVEDLKLGISLYYRQGSLPSMTIGVSVSNHDLTVGNHFVGRTLGEQRNSKRRLGRYERRCKANANF